MKLCQQFCAARVQKAVLNSYTKTASFKIKPQTFYKNW